jgi:diguanylate cyclase (GGDEF)-like protein
LFALDGDRQIAERGPEVVQAVDARFWHGPLGHALKERGEEVSRSIVELWEQRCSYAAAHAGPAVKHDIVRTTHAATTAIVTYLIEGTQQTDEQKRIEASTGKAPLRDSISLADLTKLYLFWRDATLAVIRQEAQRLGLARSAVDEAIDIVRAGSDGSIVRMVKQFDAERERLQEELECERSRLAHEALHDALTGLPNRKLFFDRLTEALARGSREPVSVAVVFIDVDRFKAVNDSCGHLVGDQLLIAIAARLRQRVRQHDTVARLAGDEFVVLAEGLERPRLDTAALQRNIKDSFAEPFTIGLNRFHVSASVGAAIGTNGSDPDVLLTAADRAMYSAKHCSQGV